MTNLYDVMHTWNAFGFVQPKQEEIISYLYALRKQISVISSAALLNTALRSSIHLA